MCVRACMCACVHAYVSPSSILFLHDIILQFVIIKCSDKLYLKLYISMKLMLHNDNEA